MVLPLLKLGTVALRTLSKPIAGRLKTAAGFHSANLSSTSPRRTLIFVGGVESLWNLATLLLCCISAFSLAWLMVAFRTNHHLTTIMQRRIYGHATNVEIGPLNEERAVQAAADLVGEFFIFSVAGDAIIFEVQRNSRSEAKRKELRKKEIEELKQRDNELAKEVELLRNKIQEFERQPKGIGIAGVFKSKQAHNENGKSTKRS